LEKFLNQSKPCQKPITYSIAELDTRFGLTKTEVLDSLSQAEIILESPINKELFEYSPTGDLKINFIYDYRQKATDTLQKMGIVINDDQSTYEALKAKYNSLIASYKKQKAQIDTMIASYEAERSSFEKDVKYWNSRGGAKKVEYDQLEQKRIELNNQVATINQAEDSLNEVVDAINSAEVVLNKFIVEFNLQVSTYNTVSSSTGKEFNEGEYISNASGTTVNIFQFNDKNQLLRVLVHELGHSLGLEHLDNPKAIMYYLNEGKNDKLTADDLTALKKVCGID
jgi:chromosome segregation ATPase